VVSTSSYYAWRHNRSYVSVEQLRLHAAAKTLFADSRESLGSRTMSKQLRKQGYDKGRYATRTLMKTLQLTAKNPARHRYMQYDKAGMTAGNQLDRAFNPAAPNQRWTGDITYIRVRRGWTYLAVVMDLFARRVVGWAMSEKPDSTLVIRAVDHAYRIRKPAAPLLFHSDQGCQYTSVNYQSLLQEYGIEPSMSRKGNCWDNAPTERLFRSLKHEWIPKGGYACHDQAQRDVAEYLMGYYNQRRLHSYNGYLTPVEREQQWQRQFA
jgi:putative transposase